MVRTRSAPLHRNSHSLAVYLSLPINKTPYYSAAGKYHKFKICKLLYNHKNKYVQHCRVLLTTSLKNSNSSKQSACFLKFSCKIFNLKPFRSVNKWRNTTGIRFKVMLCLYLRRDISNPLKKLSYWHEHLTKEMCLYHETILKASEIDVAAFSSL